MKADPSQAKRARLAEQYAALGRVGLVRPADASHVESRRFGSGEIAQPGRSQPDPVRG